MTVWISGLPQATRESTQSEPAVKLGLQERADSNTYARPAPI